MYSPGHSRGVCPASARQPGFLLHGRPLTDTIVRVPGITGATELGDGQAVLILDAMALIRASRKSQARPNADPAIVGRLAAKRGD